METHIHRCKHTQLLVLRMSYKLFTAKSVQFLHLWARKGTREPFGNRSPEGPSCGMGWSPRAQEGPGRSSLGPVGQMKAEMSDGPAGPLSNREKGLVSLFAPLERANMGDSPRTPCSLAARPLVALRDRVGARLWLAVQSPRSRPPRGPARGQIGIRLEKGSAFGLQGTETSPLASRLAQTPFGVPLPAFSEFPYVKRRFSAGDAAQSRGSTAREPPLSEGGRPADLSAGA